MNARENVAENLTLAVFAFRCGGEFGVPRKCQRIFTNDLGRVEHERLHFVEIFCLRCESGWLSQGTKTGGKTGFIY